MRSYSTDGEWISEVIDDKLYLIKEDFDEAKIERYHWLELQNRKSPEEEYRTVMQTGSRALYFAQCSDSNETWLPLLEKAFAKAHGDYSAIDGGFVGEGYLPQNVVANTFSWNLPGIRHLQWSGFKQHIVPLVVPLWKTVVIVRK